MADSVPVSGLWPAGHLGTMWTGKLRPEDVDRIRRFCEQHPEGGELVLYQNKVEDGSKKAHYSVALKEPWKRDQQQAPAPAPQSPPIRYNDAAPDDDRIPF